MAAGVKHNAYEIAVVVGRITPAIERELEDEISVQAQAIARKMREKAPKFQSLLVNSIGTASRGRLDWLVAPGEANGKYRQQGMDYGRYQESGTRPGRGLPRFSDPEAGDIIRWLEKNAFAGTRAPRRTSMRAVQRNLELRDRYQGLSWHIFHHGTKATPFVKPTALEMAPVVAAGLRAAVQRGIASAGGAAS